MTQTITKSNCMNKLGNHPDISVLRLTIAPLIIIPPAGTPPSVLCVLFLTSWAKPSLSPADSSVRCQRRVCYTLVCGVELGWWDRGWRQWQRRHSSVNVGEGEHVLNWVRSSRAISVSQSWTTALFAKHFEVLAESLKLQCFALSMHILLTGLRGVRAKTNWSKKAQTGADCPLDICLVGVSIPSHSTCNFSHMVHNWYGLNN